jgi:hypothetical protein
MKAAHMAIHAKLGASEWEGFIDRVPRCEKCEPQAVYAARSYGDKPSVDLVSAWDALRRRLDIAESQILALHWHTYERLLHGE